MIRPTAARSARSNSPGDTSRRVPAWLAKSVIVIGLAASFGVPYGAIFFKERYEDREWARTGLSGYEIDEWKREHIKMPSAVRWRNAGFKPPHASIWIGNGFGPEEAGRWNGEGFPPTEAAAWRGNGFSVEEAAAWRAHGFYHAEASHWKRNGAGPADAARRNKTNRRRVSSFSRRRRQATIRTAQDRHESGRWRRGYSLPPVHT